MKASKEALASLAAACIKRKINQALLGLREVDLGPNPVFTPKDLQVLVNTFPESGFTHKQRLAVLYRSAPHRRAQMFAFLAILHGWNVRAFDDCETALNWLASVEQNRWRQKPSPPSGVWGHVAAPDPARGSELPTNTDSATWANCQMLRGVPG